MNTIDIAGLVDNGYLPEDTMILSTHNNIITCSECTKTVSRIACLSSMMSREDPGDLVYSHALAWQMGESHGVLRPISPKPTVYEGTTVISTYPKRDKVDWHVVSHAAILTTIDSFNDFNFDNFPDIRSMDVTNYAWQRLDDTKRLQLASDKNIELVAASLMRYQKLYPFSELTSENPALVHGDVHTGNIVMTEFGKPLLIDLDSAAKGPRQYDLASWLVRYYRGEQAPVKDLVKLAEIDKNRSVESFRALIGWKILSSMTHTLRYCAKEGQSANLFELASIASRFEKHKIWSAFS